MKYFIMKELNRFLNKFNVIVDKGTPNNGVT